VDVSVRAPQAAGEYHGTVTITGCTDEVCTSEVEGSPVVVPVTYEVTGTDAPTALVASPAPLVFQQAAGDPDPAPQTVALSQRGGGGVGLVHVHRHVGHAAHVAHVHAGIGHGAARHDRGDGARRRAPGRHDALGELGELLLPDRTLRADLAEHRAGPADVHDLRSEARAARQRRLGVRTRPQCRVSSGSGPTRASSSR
jgi:hypothetical protein